MGILDDAIREHLELKRRHGVAEEELQRQQEEALGPARRDVATADAEGGEAAAEADDVHGAETQLQQAEPTEGAAATEPESAEGVAPAEPEPAPEAADAGAAERSWTEPAASEAASEEAAQEASALEPAERKAWPETQPSGSLESGVGQPTQPFDAQGDQPWPDTPAELEPEATERADEAWSERQPGADEASHETSAGAEAAERPWGEASEPAAAQAAGDETVLEPKADHPTTDPVLDPDPPARTGDTPARGYDLFDDDEPFAEEREEDEEEDEPESPGEDVLEDTPDFLQETPEHDRLWFEQKPPRDFDFD